MGRDMFLVPYFVKSQFRQNHAASTDASSKSSTDFLLHLSDNFRPTRKSQPILALEQSLMYACREVLKLKEKIPDDDRSFLPVRC